MYTSDIGQYKARIQFACTLSGDVVRHGTKCRNHYGECLLTRLRPPVSPGQSPGLGVVNGGGGGGGDGNTISPFKDREN